MTFCDGGGNGAFTAVALQELGYRNVATLKGGFYAWVGAGLPITDPADWKVTEDDPGSGFMNRMPHHFVHRRHPKRQSMGTHG